MVICATGFLHSTYREVDRQSTGKPRLAGNDQTEQPIRVRREANPSVACKLRADGSPLRPRRECAKVRKSARGSGSVSDMRPSLLAIVASALSFVLSSAMLVLASPETRFWFVIGMSICLGGAIGILVRRVSLACVLAFVALAVGTFGGYLVFAESIFLRIGGTSYWWTAQVGLASSLESRTALPPP